jgi:phospholipid transport system substrate-binding protein
MTFLKHAGVALIMAVFALSPAHAQMSAPSDPAATTIANLYATLTDTMKHGHELGAEGRFQKLAPAVDAAFNIPVMVQFVVGPSWSTMSPADQQAVTAAFRRYTIADYAHNFDSFNGERFVINPSVIVRGADHVVQTMLYPAKGDAVTLNYRMRQVGDSWKIVDVFLQGYVSELSTRRSDYAATVASGGGAALAKKLNALASSLLS